MRIAQDTRLAASHSAAGRRADVVKRLKVLYIDMTKETAKVDFPSRTAAVEIATVTGLVVPASSALRVREPLSLGVHRHVSMPTSSPS